MRSFFSYYGGKWRDAPKYPAPAHDVIIEPFAGAAGYATRYNAQRVRLYDVDPIICGVWSFLIAVSPAEVMALPDVPEVGTVDDLRIPQEARWLIGFWINSGTSAPRKRPSAWMRSGIRPGSYWGPRVRGVIASQVDLIRHWTITQASYEEIPNTRATWFVDPPYQGAGRHYRHGSKGIDYPGLGEWCRERQGKVIVCEQAGAQWLPFVEHGDRKTARRQRSAEVVWTSRASEGGGA